MLLIKSHETITIGLLYLLEHYIEEHIQEDSFPSFENPIFEFRQGVFDCNCEPAGPNEEDPEHEPNCPMMKPNFLFKPNGFELSWYKHIGRSLETNREILVIEFDQMIRTCINSLSIV